MGACDRHRDFRLVQRMGEFRRNDMNRAARDLRQFSEQQGFLGGFVGKHDIEASRGFGLSSTFMPHPAFTVYFAAAFFLWPARIPLPEGTEPASRKAAKEHGIGVPRGTLVAN